jgi:hypothetical protein
MSGDGKIAGAPMDAFVKGGTTSTAWDREKKKQYEQSKARRAHQDRQRAAVAFAGRHSGVSGALLTMDLGAGAAKPKVVLTYKAKDQALEQECLAEIALTAASPEAAAVSDDVVGMILVVVCPKCLERTGEQDDSQIMIKSWHREFWLDETKKSVWVNSVDGSVHQIAGTVTAKDLMRCSALGCEWKFRIDESKLYGSHYFGL